MSEIAAALPSFSNKPIRAAIIDLDGTMVDTADDFVAALNAMLARIGSTPSRCATKWSAMWARGRRT